MVVPRLALGLLAVSLLAAGCVKPSATGGTLSPASTAPAAVAPDATGVLAVETFKGTTMGGGADTPARAVCVNPTGVTSRDHIVAVAVKAKNATARVEVAFKATAPTSQLQVSVWDGDPADGGKRITTKTSGSPVVFDLEADKLKGVSSLSVSAFVCNGVEPSLPFQGAASFFAGAIPQGYSALKG
jgi:hypothetical protein